jgi:hypothetical protein
MTGTLRIVLLATLLVSLLGTAAAAENDPHLNVIVRFSADLPPGLVTDAEKSATRVFEKASVTAQWLNCPARGGEFVDASCNAPPAPTDLVLHIVPGSQRSSDAVFGVAFVTGSAGAYADIFLDRVQRIHDQARNVSIAALLGSVFAHEIGHLLLGEHSHSRDGLMVGQWHLDQLNKIGKGSLFFDSKDAHRLRARAVELSTAQMLAMIASESGN